MIAWVDNYREMGTDTSYNGFFSNSWDKNYNDIIESFKNLKKSFSKLKTISLFRPNAKHPRYLKRFFYTKQEKYIQKWKESNIFTKVNIPFIPIDITPKKYNKQFCRINRKSMFSKSGYLPKRIRRIRKSI